jgi:hypothetical protein
LDLEFEEHLLNIACKSIETWIELPRLLFGKDIILIGGSYAGDCKKFTREEREKYFFVQLNHHIKRRSSDQPCDWLITRQGSGMVSSEFLKLPSSTIERIKIISCQVNNPKIFQEWVMYGAYSGKIISPFHETGYAKENPFHSSLEWCNQFWNEIRTNPFIGVLAVKMILMFPIRSLKIIGFDFYKDPAVASWKTNISCHNVGNQVRWLMHQYRTDFRIEVDSGLLETFKAFGDIRRGIDETFDTRD